MRLQEFAQKAKVHLEERFEGISLTLVSIDLERITKEDLNNDRNWFVLVTYQHHENGFVQMVPMLVDGSIVLSSNE